MLTREGERSRFEVANKVQVGPGEELRGDVEDDLEGQARDIALCGATCARCLRGVRTTVVGYGLDRPWRGSGQSESIIVSPIL